MNKTYRRPGALGLLLLLATCCGRHGSAPFSFPPELAGAWKLTGVEERATGSAPEAMRRFGPRRIRHAVYDGAGKVDATVYELASDAGGLELEQTWKPAADTVAFHRGRYFAVVHWEAADRSAVSNFARELGKLLAASD